MIKSSPILPITIYDDLFDQQRFNFHGHKVKQLDLVYPANELPFFQLSRDKKYELPDRFFLRNVCSDDDAKYYKFIPEPANIFSSVAATETYGAFPLKTIWTVGPTEIQGEVAVLDPCGGIVETSTPYTGGAYPTIGPFASLSFNIIDTVKIRYKLIVDKFIRGIGSTFTIKVYDGGTGGVLLETISAPGTYIIDFTSVSTYIKLVFDGFQANDKFKISYHQAWVINPLDYSGYATDVELDETKLKVLPLKDGTDIIAYCEAAQNYVIQPGEYYYIVVSGGDVFFSETFKVIPIKAADKYYRLKWWNSCDINNSVIYNTASLACLFYNTLYLEAALFKPEPETRELGDENGAGDLNTTFASWKKNINFEIPKSPEFLTDSLSAIFMHDNIYVRKPLNYLQENVQGDIRVKRVIPDISQTLMDYFQKVNLKLLLVDLFTKTDCCTGAIIFECDPCQYTAVDTPCAGSGYQIILSGPPDVGDGLKDCTTGDMIELQPDDLICYNGKYYNLIKISGIWNVNYIAPTATWTSTPSAGNYLLEGYVVPNSFAVVEYNLNGGGWVAANSVGVGSDGIFAIVFDSTGLGTITDLKVRVKSKTLNCDFGASDVIEII